MSEARVSTRSEDGSVQTWDAETIQRLLSGPARVAQGWVPGPPANKPVISLAAGVPDAPTFPVAEVGAAVRTVLAREASSALEYLLGTPGGIRELRELVIERMEPEPGVALSAANVSITSGSAQAFANICQTLLDPGDTVVIEAPTYAGAIRAAQGSAARFAGVPMDEQGMRTDLLAETLERLERAGERPKFIYTIPTFHNPSGTTMTVERRRQLIEIAARQRVLIVEDDAYGELRYRGEPLPSVFSLANGEGVLRCGTVSKTIAPGLRVGWIKGPQPIIDALVRMRFDNGTSPFAQLIVRAYVEAGAYEPHVAVVRDVYKRKFEAMDAALGEHLSQVARWTDPDGGFFIWVTLPEGVDCMTLQPLAWDEGVSFYPGPAFFMNEGGEGHLRLAFSAVRQELIGEGVARLGRALARAAGRSA